MFIERWGRTDTGIQRLDNQDAIYFAQAGKDNITQAQIVAHGVLLAVADGVGGEVGGHEASHAVMRHLVAAYYNASIADPTNNLQHAIQQADRLAQQEVPHREAATTLVTAVIWQNWLFVANIGDSRAYWMRGNEIRQLTKDHVQDGKLARYMVSYPNVQPDMVNVPDLQPGDRILLCSDGLHDTMSEQEIGQLARQGSAKQATKRLIKAANQRGGPDNISVVLAYLRPQPPLAAWQIGMIAGLILVIGLLIGVALFALLSGQDEDVVTPTLVPTVPTAVVPATETQPPAQPEPTMTQESIEPTLPATGQQATATLAPTRTPLPTPTNTHVPPPPTPTFTPRPVLPTNTPSPQPATSEPIPTTELPSPTPPASDPTASPAPDI